MSEACFQQNVLRFAGAHQWLQYDNHTYQYDRQVTLPRFEIPLVLVTEGTHPAGSEWARVGVPSCRLCDQSICGPGTLPNMSDAFVPGYWMGNDTYYGGEEWFQEEVCSQHCAGHNLTACPPGMTQFAEPLPSISGYSGLWTRQGMPYSLVDRVVVPSELEAGEYLLSWRWDCEHTHQIWQNCADVRLT